MHQYVRPVGGVLAAIFVAGLATTAHAQVDAPPPTGGAQASADIEVVTRGPIHEAFGSTLQLNPVQGAVADRAPPSPIEEVPPEVKPSGENVLWIPGYWGWDAETKDYLWVSGIWRASPPNSRWVPGYWKPGDRGAQWYSGFWMKADAETLVYMSAPPKSIERGPAAPGETDSQFYVPGSWEPNGDKYRWRPGYWAPYQQNWVWTPSRFVATASGHVFVPGFWDHQLNSRAQLFAPIRIGRTASANASVAANATAALRYVPSQVLDVKQLQLHLFTQANANGYLFGNYYDESHAKMGIRPWFDQRNPASVVDPLIGYTNWSAQLRGENYVDRLRSWNKYFLNNPTLRPASNLTGQLQLAGSQQAVKHLSASLLSTPLTQVVGAAPDQFLKLSAEDHSALALAAGKVQLFGQERLKAEGAGGLLNVGATASQAIQLPIAPLRLTNAGLPAVGGVTNVVGGVNVAGGATKVVGGLLGGGATRAVPVEPAKLLQEAPTVLRPVEGLLQNDEGLLPRLPF